MEVREQLKEIIEKAKDAAIAAGELPEGEYAPMQRLEVPKSKEFGDYSTNASMRWAKAAHRAPAPGRTRASERAAGAGAAAHGVGSFFLRGLLLRKSMCRTLMPLGLR